MQKLYTLKGNDDAIHFQFDSIFGIKFNALYAWYNFHKWTYYIYLEEGKRFILTLAENAKTRSNDEWYYALSKNLYVVHNIVSS